MALAELQQRIDGLYHDPRSAGMAVTDLTGRPLPDVRDLPAPFPTPTVTPARQLRYVVSDEPPWFVYALPIWLPVPVGYRGIGAAEAAQLIQQGAIPAGPVPAVAALTYTGRPLAGSLRRAPRWVTPPRPRRPRKPRLSREPRPPRFARPPRKARRPRPERQPRAARPPRPPRTPRPAREPRTPRPARAKTKKEMGVCIISFGGCWVPGGCYPASYAQATAAKRGPCKTAPCRGPNDCIKGDCGTQASSTIKGILSYLPKSWQAAPPPEPEPRPLAGPARRPRPRVRELPGFPPGPSTPALRWPVATKPRCPCGATGYCWAAGCDCRLPGCSPYT